MNDLIDPPGRHTDRAAYEQELQSVPDGKKLLDELYSTYLIREYTTSIWSEMIE